MQNTFMALWTTPVTQTVCMNVGTYVCFCLIHFLKIVNFMQVQAPQIVVQYDYNIHVCSMCHDLRMRDENCLDPGPSCRIRGRAAAAAASAAATAARHFRLVGHDILKED